MIDPLVTTKFVTQWGLIGLACVCAAWTPWMLSKTRSDDARLSYCLLIWLLCGALALLAVTV